jgi:CubicO group peptidase (beta-lactamase class C family)
MQHTRIFSKSTAYKPSALKPSAFKSSGAKRLAAAVLAGSGLLFSAGLATAQTDNSIKMIDAGTLGITSAEIADIKARMQEAVTSGHLAGSLLLVGNQDGIALLESVGTQGPGDATPIDAQTIFRIYSMTKPIVSVAAMDLVEDGLLSVSDPVSKYIPEFSNMQVVNAETGALTPAQNVMTVEHLLTHKSGLIQAIFSPDTELGKSYAAQIPGDGSLTNLEVAQRIGKLPLFFEPGSAWHYGHSTDVLGAVLEVAAGKPLDAILNERIFEPLGMDETTFYVPASKASRIAEPIHGEMGDNTIVRPQLSGGGGLNSTTEDYVRFAQMLLQGGEYNGARILEPATLALMQEKRWAAAEAGFRESLRHGPKTIACLGNLGICVSMQGRQAEALDWYDKALTIDPGYELARNNRQSALHTPEGQIPKVSTFLDVKYSLEKVRMEKGPHS